MDRTGQKIGKVVLIIGLSFAGSLSFLLFSTLRGALEGIFAYNILVIMNIIGGIITFFWIKDSVPGKLLYSAVAMLPVIIFFLISFIQKYIR